jgi:hypothetical protein
LDLQTSDYIHHTLNATRIFEPSLGVAERSDTDNGSAFVIILKSSCTKLACLIHKVQYAYPVPNLSCEKKGESSIVSNISSVLETHSQKARIHLYLMDTSFHSLLLPFQ